MKSIAILIFTVTQFVYAAEESKIMSAANNLAFYPSNDLMVWTVADDTNGAFLVNSEDTLSDETGSPYITDGSFETSSIDDLSFADGYGFFLSATSTPGICSYQGFQDVTNDDLSDENANFDIVNGKITLISCKQLPNMTMTLLSGMDCGFGFCLVSGGTDGYTVVSYDISTGEVGGPLVLNYSVDFGDYSLTDVQLVDATTAIFSGLAGESTTLSNCAIVISNFLKVDEDVDPNGTTRTTRCIILHNSDSQVLDKAVKPSNSVIRTDLYTADNGEKYIYATTGGGEMSVAGFNDDVSEIIPPPHDLYFATSSDFKATSVVVDQEKSLLYFSGFVPDKGTFSTLAAAFKYDISVDPKKPTLVANTNGFGGGKVYPISSAVSSTGSFAFSYIFEFEDRMAVSSIVSFPGFVDYSSSASPTAAPTSASHADNVRSMSALGVAMAVVFLQ